MDTITMEQNVIRVMIADDHPLIRQGLEVVLGGQEDIQLVASAADGYEAVNLAKENNPDVIIMDVQMPEKDGIAALQEILEFSPDARVLILTSFGESENVIKAIRAGATGYLLKDSNSDRLLQSIREVYHESVALHPAVTSKLMQEIKKPKTEEHMIDPLTERELEVLACLSRGITNKEIAEELTISVRTVTTHVRNILDKLQLANRTQAALYAVEQGLALKT
ncbi:MAG: response regulator [Anaerolineales bacterium]